MMKMCVLNAWALFHRLKITFLLIFFSVNYGFLNRYSYDGNVWLLLTAFTIQNFALHILNNYYDLGEDEITGQRTTLSNPSALLIIATAAALFSLFLVWYFGFSLLCYFILFVLMLAYSLPIIGRWRIKKVLYLKNITGSLCWWYIPFTLIAAMHTSTSFKEIFLENAITLAIFMPFEPLWDIKDAEGDQASGIKTIPNQFGLGATKLLVVSAFLLLVVIKMDNITFVIFFLIPMILMTIIMNSRNKLIVSQIIMLFVAMHTFAGHVLLPTLILPWIKN